MIAENHKRGAQTEPEGVVDLKNIREGKGY
jgi:hypothetical protein